jgi:ribosome biogenesis protein Tsr3
LVSIFQPDIGQAIEKYDVIRCEPEKIELETVEKCVKERATRESKIFEKIIKERESSNARNSRNSNIFDKDTRETVKTEWETFDMIVKETEMKLEKESTKYQNDTDTKTVRLF